MADYYYLDFHDDMSSEITDEAIQHCKDKHGHQGYKKIMGCMWGASRFCDTSCASPSEQNMRMCRKMCKDVEGEGARSVRVVKDLVQMGFDSIIPALVNRNPADWVYDVAVIDKSQYMF